MITASKMIYDILEIASSGGLPSEFTISNEQILYWIEQTRATLIGQSLNKRDDINDSWVQHINCLEMEQVDASLCCLAPSDCTVTRSVLKIPSTIDTWKDNWIIAVVGMDGTSIPKANSIKQRYQQYNKYTKNDASWCLIDDYLYIINNPFLELVRLSGIFESPSDLNAFVNCTGQACFSLDEDYPVSLSMASQITDIIIKTKVMPMLANPNDSSNNGNSLSPKQALDNKQSE